MNNQPDETHIMQLAAISTAAIQNTEATREQRITRENEYWTQAYADVCTAVDREMKLRNALQAIFNYPVHSEPVGGAMAMQDIAAEALGLNE